jgi:hypothetical protein
MTLEGVSFSDRLKKVARATRKKKAYHSFYNKLDVRLLINRLLIIENNFVIPTRIVE